jgi:simple sugar transport system permease protein
MQTKHETQRSGSPTFPATGAHAAASNGADRRPKRSRLKRSIGHFALLPVIVLALVVGSIVSPVFLTHGNLTNVLQQATELSVVVIAEALILLVGRFDLSLESTVALAPMIAAWLVTAKTAGGLGTQINPYLALVVMALVGIAIGVVNGFLVAKLKMNAFIVTLAMLILLRGVVLGVANGKTLYGLPAPLLYLGSGSLWGLPVAVWVAAVLYLVFGLFLRYHRLGRSLYAIGSNQEAARAAGINVDRVIWGTLIVASVLAALAGLMLTGRLASVTASQGQNLIFTVMAAAVIGGVSLNGGRGSVFGALTGVLLLGLITNILTLARMQPFWIDATYGAIILAALLIARVTDRRRQTT